MGESAKILNPDKTVIMPDVEADCPMAHMVDLEELKRIKETTKDLAVVCYINSSALIKTYADVCVTSSNALKIVRNLPNKNILFIPDQNLGHYISKLVPEKNFIFCKGYCPVHKKITVDNIKSAINKYGNIKVAAHPECTPDVLEMADFIGSTSEIIDYVNECEDKEYIIATETGVFHELIKSNPDKKFYPAKDEQICAGMKLITLEKVANTLELVNNQVSVDEELRLQAKGALTRMIELAK